MAALLLEVLLLPVVGPLWSLKLVLATDLAVVFMLFALGLSLLRRESELAVYFLLGLGPFMLVIVLGDMGSFGLLPALDVFVDFTRLSVVWMALIISLGLGKRLRLLRDAQEQSAKQLMVAQAQSQAKSDFLAVMSHEIRTPLNGVMGMAELLKATGLNAEQGRIVATMESSGQALIEVINDVLDYSKIEAGKVVLDASVFNLDRLLDECLALLEARIYKQQLSLLCSVDRAVPTELCGDPARLRQVLVNLLSNAVKFTSRGGIRLSVRTEGLGPENMLLRITVSDTGIGISNDQQERIFDSFVQAESSTGRHFGGTGLGLSISRQLCRLMGGDITVESEPGRGSDFHAHVVVSRAADAPSRDQWPAGLPPVRVLLVDSDAVFCSVMQAEASLPGLDIDTVQTGQEALLRLQEAGQHQMPYQFLVTALQLQDMNGLSLHDRVRHDV
jgi:signal transduction histidine kinase